MLRTLPVLLVLAFTLGCTDGAARPPVTVRTSSQPGEGVQHAPSEGLRVDSILAMDTMIARFQEDLPLVTALDANAPRSMDELVGRFVAAVADASVAELRALTLNAAEFAHLYFPTSIYSREPYAQPPAVTWLLLEQNSLKGESRLMREYAGRAVIIEGYRCSGQPRAEGENRIREQCLLLIRTEAGEAVHVRLFGSVIERGGRYKLMSLANRL